MADKDFFIHSDRNKLRSPSSTEYRVEELTKPKELKRCLKVCREDLDLEGAQFVLKHFDELFSLIEFMDQIDYNDLHSAFEEIIVKNLNLIGSFFSNYDDIEDLPSDLRHQYTNVLKMSVYLFVEFVNSFNSKIETDYKLLLLETKGRNKIQDIIQKHTADYKWNWEDNLCLGMTAINNIFTKNITQLNDPPYIDRTLVSYIASCCYSQLENPSIAFVRTKKLRDSIMQILIVFIMDYDHAKEFKSKIIRMLRSCEHLALPIATIVLQIVESGKNHNSLIEMIVKEIAEAGHREGIKETNSLEVIGGKACCAFLVEIAKQCPNILLPKIKYLLPCLESDPYSMRICVLSVLKELIIHVLCHDELSSQEKKLRDNYLIFLQDHMLDVNAFVRCKTLQLLSDIVNENCLPKDMYKVILKSTEEKLHDKSSYVTKSAIHLIKILIKSNPYSCDFTEKILHSKIEEENSILKNLEQKLVENSTEVEEEDIWTSIELPLKIFLEENFKDGNLKPIDKSEKITKLELPDLLKKISSFLSLHKFQLALKYILVGKKTFNDEPLFQFKSEEYLSEELIFLFKNIWCHANTKTEVVLNNTDASKQMSSKELFLKICSTKSKIAYLQDCVEYLHIIEKSLNTMKQLLFGDTVSETIEAIDFFTTAYQFGVSNTQEGINAMLSLIYSTDVNVKEAMLNAYKTIYLNSENEKDGQSTTQTLTIMTRLVNLVKTLNVTDRKAFKVLIFEWVKNDSLNEDCMMLLWAWFTKTASIAQEDRVVAALILSLIASAKPSIAEGNLDSLVQFGLCDDYHMFIYSCQTLEHIAGEDFLRFPENHEIVDRVSNIVVKCFNESDVQMFNDVASNAVNLIYKIIVKPDCICLTLIKKLHKSMKTYKDKDIPTEKDDNIQQDCELFAKLIFIIGHVALQQSEHLENYIAKELIRVVKEKYQLKKSKIGEPNADNNIHDSEAAEIEGINDRILQVCDKQLVTGKGALSFYSKSLLKACDSNCLNLKTNAVLTLIKFMMVSTPFCKKNLPLFLNLIENSDNVEISINLIVGFGWLIFKHPNVLGPCTDKIYGRLSDKCTLIRYTALMTIVDLIRQEIIKAKSQIAGIAKLIIDEDEKIKYTAKQFFRVIAERGNTLYNVISDIISILSNPEDMIPEDDFQIIMKFLFSLINKDRQFESIVDKLCIRLKESTNNVQEYYISYCLMIIKYTEKSLTKLSDNITYYSDKLKNPRVYNNFNIIISSNSRMAKPVIKDILSELTNKIEKTVQDEDFAIPLSQKTPRKRLTTLKKKPLKSTLPKLVSVNEEEAIAPLQVVTKRTTKHRSNVKRKLIVNDSEEENNEDLAHVSDVGNISQTVNIKVSNCTSPDNVDVFKQNTKQKTSTYTKKLRHKS